MMNSENCLSLIAIFTIRLSSYTKVSSNSYSLTLVLTYNPLVLSCVLNIYSYRGKTVTICYVNSGLTSSCRYILVAPASIFSFICSSCFIAENSLDACSFGCASFLSEAALLLFPSSYYWVEPPFICSTVYPAMDWIWNPKLISITSWMASWGSAMNILKKRTLKKAQPCLFASWRLPCWVVKVNWRIG
jgi:hypothetical protein